MDTLGARLNYARRKRGYTQNSLAEEIGVSRGVIYNLEKDKTSPQPIVINAICQTLKISQNWLMTGDGEMEDNVRRPGARAFWRSFTSSPRNFPKRNSSISWM